MKAKLVRESINILKSKSKDEILDKLKKSDKHPNEILANSAEEGFLLGVKYALDIGASPHARSDSALRDAAIYNYINIAKLILSKSTEINNEHKIALYWAKVNNNSIIYDLIKDYINK